MVGRHRATYTPLVHVLVEGDHGAGAGGVLLVGKHVRQNHRLQDAKQAHMEGQTGVRRRLAATASILYLFGLCAAENEEIIPNDGIGRIGPGRRHGHFGRLKAIPAQHGDRGSLLGPLSFLPPTPPVLALGSRTWRNRRFACLQQWCRWYWRALRQEPSGCQTDR
jgi:hypothetical protein